MSAATAKHANLHIRARLLPPTDLCSIQLKPDLRAYQLWYDGRPAALAHLVRPPSLSVSATDTSAWPHRGKSRSATYKGKKKNLTDFEALEHVLKWGWSRYQQTQTTTRSMPFALYSDTKRRQQRRSCVCAACYRECTQAGGGEDRTRAEESPAGNRRSVRRQLILCAESTRSVTIPHLIR